MQQANPLDHVKTQIEKIKWGLTAPAMELADAGHDEDMVLNSLKRPMRNESKRACHRCQVPKQSPMKYRKTEMIRKLSKTKRRAIARRSRPKRDRNVGEMLEYLQTRNDSAVAEQETDLEIQRRDIC
ncbi:MAG: hypothetical protein R3C03_23985 [Pirellulaceae bacterium]